MRISDYEMLQRIEEKQDAIKDKFNCLPCDLNTYKLQLIQKIVFGGIAMILSCVVVAIISLVIVQGPTKARATEKVKSEKVSILRQIQIGHEPYIKEKK